MIVRRLVFPEQSSLAWIGWRAPAVDGQFAVLESDIDVVRPDPGQIGQEQNLLIGLENVDPRPLHKSGGGGVGGAGIRLVDHLLGHGLSPGSVKSLGGYWAFT